MADCYWTGAASGDPTAGGNWSTAAVPQTDDAVIFPSDATVDCLGGDLSAQDVASIIIQDGCAINLGEDGTPLEFSMEETHTFDPADVTIAADTITEVGHGLVTGQTVVFSTTNTIPPGLALATVYYVIVVDADTYQVAATYADAILGVDVADIDITGQGVGVHTATYSQGSIEDWGSGDKYITCAHALQWNIYVGSTVEIDGVNNDELNIDAAGTEIVVGPTYGAANNAEFERIRSIKEGSVTLRNVTAVDDSTAPCVDGIEGGEIHSEVALATVYVYGGELYQEEGAITTLYVAGGTCYYQADGTITLASVRGGATLDFSKDFRNRTVTEIDLYSGATLSDPVATVTWTNPIELHECSLDDCSINVGANLQYTPAAI